MLHLERLKLTNFRCFDQLDLTFEPDLTVLFAENAGGKSALLTALAMALALLQPRSPRELILDAKRDVRRIQGKSGRMEPAGPCTVCCTATVGDRPGVEWNVTVAPGSKRRTEEILAVSEAIEKVRAVGERWPLLGYYGTRRLRAEQKTSRRNAAEFRDRWDGYEGCLDPRATDGPLLYWLRNETLGDLLLREKGEPLRLFALAVCNAIKRATPGTLGIRYDFIEDTVLAELDNGDVARWPELSDGYHLFMALVGDIARRAVILNEQDGADAPLLIEGVILIDEIDLHLHPKWQRIVLDGLRAAFPKLQLIATTHSPQVLSSAKNHQVRRLVGRKLDERPVLVDGRDTNAILRELMSTDDRGKRGEEALRLLHEAIDQGRSNEARKLLANLHERWGDDAALARAERLLEEE
ncbi:AAA family ATPase [Sorangium sp. So ce1182]|uniref:AAA family ATPase n=1 Tax=Sorangium sp. So ce1182 TaxID=3133334 RepID=UPI003F6442FF